MVKRFKKMGQIAAIVLTAHSAMSFGQDAQVAGLLDQLKSSNAAVRARAAMSLGQLGSGAKSAVPALATALADIDLNVRYSSANTLKKLGPDAKGAVQALVMALKTFPGGTPELQGPARYYPDVRSVAAEALGAIGPAAKEAIPALKQATTDTDPAVRAAAAAAIKRIAVQ